MRYEILKILHESLGEESALWTDLYFSLNRKNAQKRQIS